MDGYLARQNNQTSDFGALLDLLSDKLFVSILLIWMTFNFESKIIFTVNCHLAYISENIKFLDCDSPLFHEENPIIGGLEYQKDWEMKIQNKPGLSVNIKKEYLQNHKEIKC